ncbi:Peroxisomal membrane anchor protein (Pex14) [Penicillium capsulatum]|uniref:Peroxisomal membrane protein PEX14 n=1 Tax=Penicillium capsulatum TaxID=69766 RepID=A0A9W9LGR5_9EURO|nr:Peroxisomal membrane anchor protein (Pex14) [Penicillium capsulatum]KAJ6105655.1 Peroxisomal membrane anchor protein (Pex14) [Penicillium capsulatum]
MAPREELIASAVTFLQDPSVASSPIEKRVAFLQSKNLTQEEVDLAIARAGEDPSAAAAATGAVSPSQGYPSQQVAYRPSPQPPQGYGYPPYGQWQPPPEPPKRDWRDWFIMGTVMGGVGYGLYFVTKVWRSHGSHSSSSGRLTEKTQRYISPLIAPPTPPQLEQDKESIDEQFSRAFALIDQLSTDTAALKTAEDARTERLDTALKDVENLVGDLKTASRRRDDETRRISDEVKSLKDAIPKALEGAREGNENRLKELGTELKSLKVLLGNRLGGSGPTSVAGRTIGSSTPVAAPRPASEETSTAPSPAPNGLQATVTSPEQEIQASPAPAAPAAAGQNSSSPLSQLGRSASIPSWQMAATSTRNTSSTTSPAPASGDKPATTDIRPLRRQVPITIIVAAVVIHIPIATVTVTVRGRVLPTVPIDTDQTGITVGTTDTMIAMNTAARKLPQSR